MFLNLPLNWKQTLPALPRFWGHIFASLEHALHSKKIRHYQFADVFTWPDKFQFEDITTWFKKKNPVKLDEKVFHSDWILPGPQMNTTSLSWQVSVHHSEKHRQESPETLVLSPDYFLAVFLWATPCSSTVQYHSHDGYFMVGEWILVFE